MVLFPSSRSRRLIIFILFIFWNKSCWSLQSINSGDLIITEIMADPNPVFGLPDVEFVEFYNRSGTSVDLSGWLFYDGSVRSLPGIIIPPGAYFIVCSNSDTSLMSQFGIVAGVSSVSLTNSGEKIALYDANGFAIDSIIYDNNWYGSSYKKDGGWSLERIDNSYLCVDERNWSPAINSSGGTPGSVNSVNGTVIDNAPPVLLRAFCNDTVSVTLVFNELTDPTNLPGPSNFQFSSGLTTNGINYFPDFPDRITVQFNTPLVLNKKYTVIVSGINDCSGNIITENSVAHFGIADSTVKNGLVINEVLFNPYSNGNDFIELYNSGYNIIDLSYFKLASLKSENNEIDQIGIISEDPFLLFPGNYIVLTEFVSGVTSFYNSSFPYSFCVTDELPSMNNDEGSIALLKNGAIVEWMRYNEDNHFELLKDVEGVSLERIHPDNNSLDPGSWHSAAASYGYASPGLKNSVFTESGKENKKVSANPEIFSPDHDGIDDLVIFSVNTGIPGYISNLRIYNSSGQVIFNQSKNRLLAAQDSYTWDGVGNNGELCKPGIYIVLIELFNLSGDVSYHKLPVVLALKL